ncbi:MAG: hypothetical protein ACOC38_05765 [Promethearchaeia archaeon]
MPSEIVKKKSLSSIKALFIALIIATQILGFCVVEVVKNEAYSLALFFLYLPSAPLAVAVGGFFLGRAGKKRVEYRRPDWKFEPVQFEPSDLNKMGKEYIRKYSRVTPRSELWMWFLPVVLALSLVGFLYYGAISNTVTRRLLLIAAAILHPATLAASTYVGFQAMGNEASSDFKLPLIKEAIWLAEKQDNLPGFYNVRVVLDKAEHGGYEIFRSPRVIARVRYVEKDGYIESWSGEIRSVDRVHALLHSDQEDSVKWYWRSMDRQFRESRGSNSYGHYVKEPPFPRSKLSVKDVENVLTAAEILLLREWIGRQEGHDDAENLLSRIHCDDPGHEKAS